jgi:tRNA nucleotidyltransferase (CCA-adding enzyme)
MMRRLHELELLEAIHPDWPWDDLEAARIEALHGLDPDPDWELTSEGRALQTELGYILLLMTLSPEKTGSVVSRLKLPAYQGRAIEAAAGLWEARHTLADASPSVATAILEDVPPLARYALFHATSDYRVRGVLRSFVTRWKAVQPCTDGHELRKRGLPPGPQYKRILERLRSAWLDGEVSSLEQERELLEQLLASER